MIDKKDSLSLLKIPKVNNETFKILIYKTGSINPQPNTQKNFYLKSSLYNDLLIFNRKLGLLTRKVILKKYLLSNINDFLHYAKDLMYFKSERKAQ